MDIAMNPATAAIEDLLEKEKTARMNNDIHEQTQISKNILQLAWEMGDHNRLIELLQLLFKKRGQQASVHVELVAMMMLWIQGITDKATKIKLLEAVKGVCEKKIYLEVEYARCCISLVKLSEDESYIIDAARIFQEVQVETYSSMDQREKLEFILYQMRLMLKQSDYIRLQLTAEKINQKTLNKPEFRELKCLYLSYLIKYHLATKNFFQAAVAYKGICEVYWEDATFQLQPQQFDFEFDPSYESVFTSFVVFLVISPYAFEKDQLMQDLRINRAEELGQRMELKQLIEAMLHQDLISSHPQQHNLTKIPQFSGAGANVEEWLLLLRKQLVQHNIRIIQKYYSQIHLERMSQLLKVPASEIENEICELINEKAIQCKIDRVSGIINWNIRQTENEILNDWAFDMNKVLSQIDHTVHLIQRDIQRHEESQGQVN